LHIATVLDARSLPAVVAEVTIVKFCEQIMSITSIIISACSLWVHLFFDLSYLVVKIVPFFLCLQGGLIRFRRALLYHLEPPMYHQHVICIERGSCLISRTFCGRIGSIFLQFSHIVGNLLDIRMGPT